MQLSAESEATMHPVAKYVRGRGGPVLVYDRYPAPLAALGDVGSVTVTAPLSVDGPNPIPVTVIT